MLARIRKIFRRFPTLSMFTTVVVCLGLQGAFTFCTKTCPGFLDPNFDSWFPYQNGQSIKFSSNFEVDTLKFDHTYRTETEKKSGFEARCYTPYAEYNGKTALDSLPFILRATSDNSFPYGMLGFKGVTITLDSIDAAVGPILINAGISETFHTRYTINGKTFSEVQEIIIDTTIMKGPRIVKLFIAKHQGIVGYEDYPSHQVWVKQ